MFRDVTVILLVAIALLSMGIDIYEDWKTAQLTEELAALRDEKTHWQSEAIAQASRADKQEQLRQSADKSVRHLQSVLAERQHSYDALNNQVRNAPESDNGPVAPVLRSALEGLP